MNNYKHVTEEDMKEAKMLLAVIKGLDSVERAMVKTYATALKDRKMYAEFA